MKIDTTFLKCIVGLIFFSAGGTLRMFMVVRATGWKGYLGNQSAAIDSYRGLIASKQAPRWPLPISYFLLALGIVTVFTSILLANNT